MSCSKLETSEKVLKKYNFLILVYILVLSAIPMFTRNVIPEDMVENLYWGKEWQAGYGKHPPLFAWISYIFYKASFSIPESMYLLTQLNLLLGFYFIFRISELIFRDKNKSYASIFIFMSSICAVFGNEKFNANTILMSLLPAMFYFFIRMLKFHRKRDAVLLGFFSAMAFLGKYFSLLFMGCMLVFLLTQRECIAIFKTSLPYLVMATFLICVFPHLQWMQESDFVTLKYAMEKSTHAKRTICSAFNFLMMQVLFFATSFFAFSYAYSYCVSGFFRGMNFLCERNKKYSLEERFVIFITIIPCLILFLVSLITGMRIGSFWGTNMFMLLGIYLLIINKKRLHMSRLFLCTVYLVISFSVLLLVKLGPARYFLKNDDPVKIINYYNVAEQIETDWCSKFGNRKIRYIRSDKAMGALHVYLKDSPSLYDVKSFNRFNLYGECHADSECVAAFLCKENGEKITNFRKFYGRQILFDNIVKVIDKHVVYYAFLNKNES